jgi:hypothetical protein
MGTYFEKDVIEKLILQIYNTYGHSLCSELHTAQGFDSTGLPKGHLPQTNHSAQNAHHHPTQFSP